MQAADNNSRNTAVRKSTAALQTVMHSPPARFDRKAPLKDTAWISGKAKEALAQFVTLGDRNFTWGKAPFNSAVQAFCAYYYVRSLHLCPIPRVTCAPR